MDLYGQEGEKKILKGCLIFGEHFSRLPSGRAKNLSSNYIRPWQVFPIISSISCNILGPLILSRRDAR